MITSASSPEILNAASQQAFDVGGPTIQFLVNNQQGPVLMRGVVSPGVVVPLHGHADPETFYILSGELEGLQVGTADATWVRLTAGDVCAVPANVPHAWRNLGSTPAVVLVTTTPVLGGFFAQIGVPAAEPGAGQWPPTPEMIAALMRASDERGYWTGTPEENLEVGLELGPPPDL